MKCSGTIDSVKSLLDILETEINGTKYSHLKMWFRGQSNSEWKLETGVYRHNFTNNNSDELLEKERLIYQDFRVQSSGLLTGVETEAELYFLQQHYGIPTRLLDWTKNPLNGLYFAIGDNEKETDSAFFMMDANKLANCRENLSESVKPKFRGIATARHPIFEETIKIISRWCDLKKFPNFIFPVRPDHRDRRMSLQQSCFTFHVPKSHTLDENNNNTLKKFCVPYENQAKIKKDLQLLGVNKFSIYGDMQNLGHHLKSLYS